ncbi:hypothetical protein ETB97_008465 [Aspergillus alliaceus]|uniref:Uncharacterized protein n=1 Tax=Petromyces alliaceus TaxID=209559 RepID=A0A8H6E2F1_PETAA|nr:hypothetical protein ETB97_008465 [Aspergillus burnettii]
MPYLARVQPLLWVHGSTRYFRIKNASQEVPREHVAFEKDSQGGLLQDSPYANNTQQLTRWWQRPRLLIIGHVFLFAFYIATLVAVVKRNQLLRNKTTLPFPRRRSLGMANSKIYKSGHDLLNAENIIIEPEYIKELGRENIGVAVPEGTGYLDTLNVYHELHCLKSIYRFMYPDYYFPGFTEEEHEMN